MIFGHHFADLDSKPDPNLGKCTQEHDETIYQGILATQIKLVKGFTLMTSAIGLSCQPILYLQLQQNSAHFALIAGTGAFLSFFTFVTPILTHQICKKYVTELNYNKLEDCYTATIYSFFLRKKQVSFAQYPHKIAAILRENNSTFLFQIKFKLNDVQVPDLPGIFTTFRAKNVPLFVDSQCFYDAQHYSKIMGYDKQFLEWQKRKEEEK